MPTESTPNIHLASTNKFMTDLKSELAREPLTSQQMIEFLKFDTRGQVHTEALCKFASEIDGIVIVSNGSLASLLRMKYYNIEIIPMTSFEHYIGTDYLSRKPILIDNSCWVEIMSSELRCKTLLYKSSRVLDLVSTLCSAANQLSMVIGER